MFLRFVNFTSINLAICIFYSAISMEITKPFSLDYLTCWKYVLSFSYSYSCAILTLKIISIFINQCTEWAHNDIIHPLPFKYIAIKIFDCSFSFFYIIFPLSFKNISWTESICPKSTFFIGYKLSDIHLRFTIINLPSLSMSFIISPLSFISISICL